MKMGSGKVIAMRGVGKIIDRVFAGLGQGNVHCWIVLFWLSLRRNCCISCLSWSGSLEKTSETPVVPAAPNASILGVG